MTQTAVSGKDFVWRGSRAFCQQVLLIAAFTCVGVAQPPSGIQNLISAGTLAGMRWPNFSDYQPWLQKFYDTRTHQKR